MTLGLVPKILNSIDMIATISKNFGMIDPVMLKIRACPPAL